MSLPLTADLCAVALVAAARSYGDDPVRAFQSRTGVLRRSLTPAATAISAHTGMLATPVCEALGIRFQTYYGAAQTNKPAYRAAVRAALEALQRGGPTGTVHAPPPVALKAPSAAAVTPSAPQPPAPPVDHTDAIREAIRRRKGVQMTVVGVEKDQALLPPVEAGGCAWPLGDLKAGTLRACGDTVVLGRMYCAVHCKASGQKATPKVIATVGRVARPYGARELEAEA